MTRYSPLASPTATIAALERWGLHTDKSLGQHFLIDDGVVGRILRLANLEPGEQVVEVGPGIGTLTAALLAAGAQVCALEKDARLVPALEELLACYPTSLNYHLTDALTFEPAMTNEGNALHRGGALTARHTCPGLDPGAQAAKNRTYDAPFKLVANLPYQVAATLVLDYFQRLPGLMSATVMVQSEVAARMAAAPGSKDYGSYSIKLQLLTRVGESFTVSPQSFLPPPRVSSTVIRLDRLPLSGADAPALAAASLLADAAFAERRKTIRNSLRSSFSQRGMDTSRIDPLLERAGIAPTVRGETLTVADYQNLGTLWEHTP